MATIQWEIEEGERQNRGTVVSSATTMAETTNPFGNPKIDGLTGGK
jgi:hypothetical protein